MDGIKTTDTELAQDAANENAGAAGEAGNLKWTCPDCTQAYRIEKPGPQMTASLCEHRIHGRTCQRRFYHGIRENNGPAVMVMWPHPEEAEAPKLTIADAARDVRDKWRNDHHYTEMFASVQRLCDAVEAEDAT